MRLKYLNTPQNETSCNIILCVHRSSRGHYFVFIRPSEKCWSWSKVHLASAGHSWSGGYFLQRSQYEIVYFNKEKLRNKPARFPIQWLHFPTDNWNNPYRPSFFWEAAAIFVFGVWKRGQFHFLWTLVSSFYPKIRKAYLAIIVPSASGDSVHVSAINNSVTTRRCRCAKSTLPSFH